ncbi:MAG: hypothetical protein IT305_14115 [Chloroflexi bacterium]|nr:hypothetical protein [Chloroflexota bacterium]
MVRERLTGLLPILAGLAGFGLAYALWAFSVALLPMPTPLPGLRPDLLRLLSPGICSAWQAGSMKR